MEAAKAPTKFRYYSWLPFLAVFQTDLRSTTRNWVWRTWVFTSLGAAVLYLTHRFAVYREAGWVLTVDKVVANLLHWTALATVTLVVAFTCGAIATERGSLADSVLCRGISRYQYFFAKLHARLLAVLGTYLILAGGLLGVAAFVFPGLVTLTGCAAAIGSLGAVLAAIVCCGVATSAVCGSTVISVTLLWVTLYGIGFGLTFLPVGYVTPDRLIDAAPRVLRGEFDRDALWFTCNCALVVAAVASLAGAVGFSRKDV